jgi:general secretion pathway protein B
MSYILDALRKSEHERQVAAGQSAGMLYPIEIKRDRKLLLPVGMVVLTAMITCALIWLWLQSAYTEQVSVASEPTTVAAIQLPATAPKLIAAAEPEVKKLMPELVQKKIKNTLVENAPPKPIVQSEARSKEAAVITQASNADPLKDLPALSITGYIRNEQSGNLAMINNQLVREGEEIAPGLLLVKILDDSAIFSYKGYVFSR